MRPFLSSNATSQMEGKPIGHIHYVYFTAPHGVSRVKRVEKIGGGEHSEDKGGALYYSLGLKNR